MRSILLLVFVCGCTVTTRFPGAKTSTTSASPSSSSASTTPTSSPASTTSTLPRDRDHDPDATFVGSGNHLQAGEHANRDDKNCDGAHDHCLPIGSVFAQDLDLGNNDVYVAWPTDNGPWVYVRLDVMRGQPRTYVTERATTRNVSVGARVIYYADGGTVPLSEASAAAGQWTVGTIEAVDGKRLRVDGASVIIAGARLVTETK